MQCIRDDGKKHLLTLKCSQCNGASLHLDWTSQDAALKWRSMGICQLGYCDQLFAVRTQSPASIRNCSGLPSMSINFKGTILALASIWYTTSSRARRLRSQYASPLLLRIIWLAWLVMTNLAAMNRMQMANLALAHRDWTSRYRQYTIICLKIELVQRVQWRVHLEQAP